MSVRLIEISKSERQLLWNYVVHPKLNYESSSLFFSFPFFLFIFFHRWSIKCSCTEYVFSLTEFCCRWKFSEESVAIEIEADHSLEGTQPQLWFLWQQDAPTGQISNTRTCYKTSSNPELTSVIILIDYDHHSNLSASATHTIHGMRVHVRNGIRTLYFGFPKKMLSRIIFKVDNQTLCAERSLSLVGGSFGGNNW